MLLMDQGVRQKEESRLTSRSKQEGRLNEEEVFYGGDQVVS